MKQIAIFASGAGSNAKRIIDHFRHHPAIKVCLIACNKPGAGVLDIAEKEQIPFIIIDKEKFFRGNAYVDELEEKGIDFLVLAGFLWKIPTNLVKAYRGRIINIHPALLPKYGGKGMYGEHVHAAVIAAKEEKTGITIHYVDELYDHGQVIFQASCPVLPDDTPQSLAQKVHMLEYEHFPRIIGEVIESAKSTLNR
jgi:phosphoribosylglycinamide formyltransferase 1